MFARQFFPENRRHNLPKVAACAPCNTKKSKLEHYLTAVLPFGGQHADSSFMLTEMVPPRLARNRKLHESLIAGHQEIDAGENHEWTGRLAVPFEAEKINALFAYIARGLSSFHWGLVVPADQRVDATMLNPVHEPVFRDLLRSPATHRIAGRVGGGAFLYQAAAFENPTGSLWRFQVYGGLVVAGDPAVPIGAPDIWVAVSPPHQPSLFNQAWFETWSAAPRSAVAIT